MAWRDEDGYFWFVGRADDVIKSSGYRIGPFEVESALMIHPAVVECAITGVPDEIRGQVVKATIVLSKTFKGKEGPELVKELQDHVKRVTAPYKYPRVIEFVSVKRINNQLWTDRSFIGKIIKNEKGFTSCVFKSGLAISKCASFGSYYMDSLWSDF